MTQEWKLEVHQRGCSVPGCVTHDARRDLMRGLEDAIDAAAEKGETTTLLNHGKAIAEIVPVNRSVKWAPYQEFGIPDPANETLEAPAHPVTIGSVGYRGPDIVIYWKDLPERRLS